MYEKTQAEIQANDTGLEQDLAEMSIGVNEIWATTPEQYFHTVDTLKSSSEPQTPIPMATDDRDCDASLTSDDVMIETIKPTVVPQPAHVTRRKKSGKAAKKSPTSKT